MERKRIETAVGFFLLAGIIAIVWLTIQVGNWSPIKSQNYEVTANFDNIGGLAVRAPVTVAGVIVGEISEINLDMDDYSAKVTLRIDQKYSNLPIDTSAAILTAGLLGAQYVGLDPGGEDHHLEEGDEIEITQSAIVLENLIGRILIRTAEEKD